MRHPSISIWLCVAIWLMPFGVWACAQPPSSGDTFEEGIVVPKNTEADGPRPVVHLSRQSIAIADPFTIRIEVAAPVGTRVVFEDVGETIGSFDILDVNDLGDMPVADSGDRLWVRTMRLETLQVGLQTVPPISVRLVPVGLDVSDDDDSEADVRVIRTQPVEIEVRSILQPDEQSTLETYRDIVGEIETPSNQDQESELGWVSWLIGLACVVAAAVLWAWYRRHDSSQRWCRDRLGELQRQRIENAAAYVEASELLKRVLHVNLMGRSGITTTVVPTPRLLERLETRGYTGKQLQTLRRVLSVADRIKFDSRAEQNVSREEINTLETAIDDAKTLQSLPAENVTASKEAA
ncbi:DUF4381 domain-containing protein [Rhodopirellula sallentina]|uniref:Putative membrane protein n=1 Tax=Rhodopirellula sallentina SM41 TaxID=1263870 RepID=M5U6W8_9BACT|nr:DUF4381 domain-containing protein [Rhodopirellula sallentina]EMI57029.1 putative membrane protein [Rhodopirellula sallentina SM41]